MEKILRFLEKYIIPRFLYRLGQPIYHPLLAFLAAAYYGFPSKKLTAIGVTGTKGKSSTIYFLSKIFEEAGYKTAAISSIQFKIGDSEWTNKLKMTMPGRFQIQKFLADAVQAGCKFAIIEVTSQGVEQSRHRFIDFDTAVFTNLAPEHIEAHGSFKAYKKAKLKFFKYVKNNHVLNKDDKYFEDFSAIPSKSKIAYSFKSLQRMSLELNLQIVGEFNVSNAIAAIKTAEIYGIPFDASRRALEKIKSIPGRMEFIDEGPLDHVRGKQNFKVIVDYAHTPDSLVAVYETVEKYKLESQNSAAKMICVLGSAGGGRDKWKRPEMGRIASQYCDAIILTNEDPYDENPEEILNQISSGFSSSEKLKIESEKFYKILDRKEAIKKAIGLAKKDDVVIMTGKGSESFMTIENNRSIPWDDRQVAREELKRLATGD